MLLIEALHSRVGRFAVLDLFEEAYDISTDRIKEQSEDTIDVGVAGRSKNHLRLFTTYEGIWATEICRCREETALANSLVTLCQAFRPNLSTTDLAPCSPPSNYLIIIDYRSENSYRCLKDPGLYKAKLVGSKYDLKIRGAECITTVLRVSPQLHRRRTGMTFSVKLGPKSTSISSIEATKTPVLKLGKLLGRFSGGGARKLVE
ncbi:hypothetical protein B9Z19DRAFT_1118947 [Tuber borchii]|uniref:Uncharacterized protein n=1 Tax=Tuber borchii TaxID=42251 RepID=A0A2T7A784_TUBBO|nr:hypothetical protein B9Z19DRAFT_1118947 [Tuber borchii]